MKVAVIGGGIAGLAAAWELASRGAEVAVYEPGHLGGKLLTSDFGGRLVDEGPDALLARVPEGIGLCHELGLDEELVAPSASKAMLWSGGRLRPLPDGLVLGAPARLVPLARSGILSMAGMARALGDLVLPRTLVGDDEGLFKVVASRFGPEVAAKLVGPLVGSIYAGTTRDLSAATVAPQLLAAAKAHRSLLAGLRRAAPPARSGTAGGVGAEDRLFVAPRGGMQAIADRLVERLGHPTMGTVFFPTEVTEMRPDGSGVVVSPGDDRYDGAVLAAPAPAAHRLLAPFVDAGTASLGPLAVERFASVGIVTLGLQDGAVPVPVGQSGVLVGPGSELLMTACSFGSNKWPHWSAPGTVVLRVSVGRAGDERWAALSDEDLVGRVLDELAVVLGPRPGGTAAAASGTGRAGARAIAGVRPGKAPTPLNGGWRVSRWPNALPQYPVGHLEDMAALRGMLARHAPTVALAGASYGRVGIPACIAAGRQAGAEVVKAVQSLRAPAG